MDAYYLKSGRYCNGSDNVLSVEAGTHGEAVILINGEEILYSTDEAVHNEMYADYACDDYVIEIYDFLDGVDGERIQFNVPKTLVGGEVYTLSDGLGVRGDSPIWAIYAPGEGDAVWSSSVPVPRAAMNACTIRVLQWDEVECVVYLAMDIVTELEPMTIEVLAVMPAYGSLWGETFKKNEAVSAGEVIIKCVYSYGKDEADVLTGISRNENHTRTKIYYVNIVP